VKFDRSGALAFLADIWDKHVESLKDGEGGGWRAKGEGAACGGWHVDLTLGRRTTTWYLGDYADPTSLVDVWEKVVFHYDGGHGSVTSYDADSELSGGRVRSSWCFFDARKEHLLLEVSLRGLVLPTLTNKREHWGAALRRSQTHRPQTKMLVDLALGKAPWVLPAIAHLMKGAGEVGENRYGGLLVKLTRIAEKMCDHDDGCNTSLKHVRDGVADAIGYDDGDLGISWHYDQRPMAKGEVPGAIVRIYERAECPTCLQYIARRA